MIQLPKAFTCAGDMQKIKQGYIFFLIGVAGAFISLLGVFYTPGQVFFVAGSSLLLSTAIYFRAFYFIALEMILLAGHGAILLGIGTVLQLALPVFLSFQLLIFYVLMNRLNHFILLIGIAGIALLSIGLSYQNQWIFFAGSIAVAAFALYDTKENSISWLWSILNGLFALSAIARLSGF